VLLESFDYIKPQSLVDAFDVLDRLKNEQVRVLAGGTDLVPRLRSQVEHVSHLVDLADCGLNEVVVGHDQIEIGALTAFATICRSRDIREKLPALYESSAQIGAEQCRTLATIGGNVCSAVPSLDSAPSLLVLDAKFRLQSKRGERVVAAENFFLGPRRTILETGEILTHIIVPLRENFTASFLRIGRRKALTLAIVNAAAGVALSNTGEVTEVRIALGAVAPTPIRAHKAEEFLLGRRFDAELIQQASEIAVAETSPISDIRASAEYRKKLVAVLVRRALGKALLRQPVGVGQ
jgi:carbon-monoxide dehydrogenase medium subunit